MNPNSEIFRAIRAALREALENEQSTLTADKLLSAAGLPPSAMKKLSGMVVGEPPIESERLFVRKTSFKDADLFRRTYGSKNIMRYLGGPVDSDRLDGYLEYSVSNWDRQGFRRGIIVEKNSLKGVGIVNVGESAIPNEPGAEIGWAVTRGAQGKGYATELTNALTNHSFEHLKSDRVLAWTHPENRASNRVFEKLNFNLLGVRRIPTKTEPQNIWELTADAWRARQST